MNKKIEIELPFDLNLSEPIITRNVDGVVVDEKKTITFKNKLNAGMVGDIPVGENSEMKMHHFFPIISKMTGETVATVKKLGFSDIQESMDVVGHFLGGGPTTGDS